MIAGHDVVIEGGGERWQLEGRDGPFAGLPSALWLPDGRELRVGSSLGPATLGVARAPRSGREGVAPEPIVVSPDAVEVEIRGAGNATRQINHIIDPDFPADRLEVVEVLTPSGNWSSWPPHKHDVDDMPAEAVLEEVYHYRFRRPEAWAIQRVYRADRSRASRGTGLGLAIVKHVVASAGGPAGGSGGRRLRSPCSAWCWRCAAAAAPT